MMKMRMNLRAGTQKHFCSHWPTLPGQTFLGNTLSKTLDPSCENQSDELTSPTWAREENPQTESSPRAETRASS